MVRRVAVVGATVYGSQDFAPLYQDLIGRAVPLQAIYDLAQRITAKYGADGYMLSRAIVPVQELEPRGAVVRIEVVEGYIEKVVWPRSGSAATATSSPTMRARITADRPTNIRTLERYLLLASDLPGLKFTTTLKASPTRPGRGDPDRRDGREAGRCRRRFDNRGTRGARAAANPVRHTINNLMGQHEAFDADATPPSRKPGSCSTCRRSYRQVLNSEGLIGLRQRQLQLGLSRHGRTGGVGFPDPQPTTSKPAGNIRSSAPARKT